MGMKEKNICEVDMINNVHIEMSPYLNGLAREREAE